MAVVLKELSPEMQRTVVMAAATLAAASLSTFTPGAQGEQLPSFFNMAVNSILEKLGQ